MRKTPFIIAILLIILLGCSDNIEDRDRAEINVGEKHCKEYVIKDKQFHDSLKYKRLRPDMDIFTYMYQSEKYSSSIDLISGKEIPRFNGRLVENVEDSILWIESSAQQLIKYDRKNTRLDSFNIISPKLIIPNQNKTYVVTSKYFYILDNEFKIDTFYKFEEYNAITDQINQNHFIVNRKDCYKIDSTGIPIKTNIDTLQPQNIIESQKHHGLLYINYLGRLYVSSGDEIINTGIGIGRNNRRYSYDYLYVMVDKSSKRKDIFEFDLHDIKLDTTAHYEIILPIPKGSLNYINLAYPYVYVKIRDRQFMHDISYNRTYLYQGSDDYIIDECGISVSKKDRYTHYSHEEYLTNFTLFDNQKYYYEAQDFELAIEELRERTFKSIQAINLVRDSIRNKYQYSFIPNFDKDLERSYMSMIRKFTTKHQWTNRQSYENKNISLDLRIAYLNSDLYSMVRQSKIDEALQLSKQFLTVNHIKDKSNSSFINTLLNYEKELINIEKTEMPEDEREFRNTMAQRIIFTSGFFCNDSCSGCDFGLYLQSLRSLLSKYPMTAFSDDIALEIYNRDHMYVEGYDDVTNNTKELETIIEKYPNTNGSESAKLLLFDLELNEEKNNTPFGEEVVINRDKFRNINHTLIDTNLVSLWNNYDIELYKQKFKSIINISSTELPTEWNIKKEIPIEIVVKNTSSEPFEFRVYSEEHPFQLRVRSYCSNDHCIASDEIIESGITTVTIPPLDSLVYTLKIDQLHRNISYTQDSHHQLVRCYPKRNCDLDIYLKAPVGMSILPSGITIFNKKIMSVY